MPHQEKKRRLLEEDRSSNDAVTASNDLLASFGALGVDVLGNVYGFLPLDNIMCSRRINKKSMEAVKNTVVPPADFRVGSVGNYNAMNVMAEALPNLQQINIANLAIGHKYAEGEDPNEGHAAYTANQITHDINIISNFRKLRILTIEFAPLNGRYPVLFNSFPLLQKFTIKHCPTLKLDLDMLAGLPLLKELHYWDNPCLIGNINSLRVLKDTLEKVTIVHSNVEGNFMDLADFPYLKKLDLRCTVVTGDIRDIDENDFSSLEQLTLPNGVYGGIGHEFQRISDGTDLVRAIYLLSKQRPALNMELEFLWYARLSEDSPDWYASLDEDDIPDSPPFRVKFAQVGSRVGYRWWTDFEPCEVNWLDPEPDRASSGYEKYIEYLRKIDGVDFYRGFHQPPTEEEYRERWFAQQERHGAPYDYDY